MLSLLTASALAQSDWSGWTDRTEIRFPGLPEGPVRQLIVPVALDDGVNFDPLASTGADLRFEDRRGNVLPYELETWDAGGHSLIWVRVRLIEDPTDRIWMYSGNPDADAGTDPAATWSGWDLVLHLSDRRDARGDVLDTIGDPAVVPGLVGTGLRFRDHDALRWPAPLDRFGKQLTVTTAVQLTPMAGGHDVMVAQNQGWQLRVCAGGVGGVLPSGSTGGFLCDPGGFDDDQWHVAAMTLGKGKARVFEDGVLRDEHELQGALWPDTRGIFVGEVGQGGPVHGVLDEVRVSHRSHSKRWIAADDVALRQQLVRICNRWTGDWYAPDVDGDGAVDRGSAIGACEPPDAGWVLFTGQPDDCDDADPDRRDHCNWHLGTQVRGGSCDSRGTGSGTGGSGAGVLLLLLIRQRRQGT